MRDEKLQYYINREAVKISALSSGKIMNILQMNNTLVSKKSDRTS